MDEFDQIDLNEVITFLSKGNRRLYNAIVNWKNLIPISLYEYIYDINLEEKNIRNLTIDPSLVSHKQLLPHLHYSCVSKLRSHPLWEEMKLEKFRNAFRNRRIKSERDAVLGDLHQHGLTPIVFKGADLAFTVYPDPSCRVVGDIDLLFEDSQYDRAVELLQKIGWKCKNPKMLMPLKYGRRTSVWTHEDYAIDLDVQNHANHYAYWSGADEMHFKSAIYQEVNNHQGFWGLCREHALVHVCCHGAAQNFYPPVRWVSDAVWILKKTGGCFDWDRCIKAAEKTRTAPIIFLSLLFLRRVLKIKIPSEILKDLRKRSRHDASIWTWSYRLEEPIGLWEKATSYFTKFHVSQPESSVYRSLTHLPDFLCSDTQSSNCLVAATKLSRKVCRDIYGS